MEILVNMLIEWDIEIFDEKSQKCYRLVERVIDIFSNGENVATMHIFGDTGFPIVRPSFELQQAYEDGALRILKIDPYAKIQKKENEIPINQRKQRDEAWMLVEELLGETGRGIYLEKIRGEAVRAIALKYEKHEKVIYSYIRRKWQRGQGKSSLLPDYTKCGGKGKSRLIALGSDKKLGRPSDLSKGDGKRRGIRITPRIVKIFEKAIKKFYLNENRFTFKMAYEKMLFEYFAIGTEEVDGVEVRILPDKSELPTEDQFRYWYNKYYRDRKKEQIARYGETDFNLSNRELISDVNSLASSPGAIFMIDATIADIYLVSGFDRKRIIGRPVVYLIVDVFSRMIVGFSVSLEGPSWQGASLALDNMVADKVELCAEYGITIQPEEWKCHSLPESIFADRGEFEGYNADILVSVFGIRIHNTSPYRGDLKSIVERKFGIVQQKFVHFLPGAVVERAYGEKPHALDATLTLYDFREMLIRHILTHNANHELTWYRPDQYQISDRVPLRPLALWNWGIKNRSGYLHTTPREIVRLNLLPRKQVSLYRQGIHFYKDIFYLRPQEIPLGSNSKIEIAYDPNNLDVIYIPSPDGRNATVCPLIPACEETYKGRTYEEVRDLFAFRKRLEEEHDNLRLQSEAKQLAHDEKIISRATNLTDEAWAATDDQSDRARLKGIRQNRKNERDAERLTGWSITENSGNPLSNLPEIPSHDEDEEEAYIPKPSYEHLLDEVVKNQQK